MILENWLKELNELFKNTHINNTKERKALEHILSDYKRVLEMNKILLKENEELKESYMCAQACANMVFDKIIPVQKVKDKIEELNKKEKKELKGMKGQDRYFVKQTYQNKRMILQELIKESEE